MTKSPNPLTFHGVWTVGVAVVLLLGGALAGLLSLGEFSRYATLTSAGNAFAASAANSGVYLLGIAATAILAGAGLLVVGIAFLSGRMTRQP